MRQFRFKILQQKVITHDCIINFTQLTTIQLSIMREDIFCADDVDFYNKKVMISDIEANINLLLKETEQSTYAHRYKRWEEFLKTAKTEGEEPYVHSLSVFLDYYPFNYEYWLDYIHYTSSETYQVALKRNSKSYELWISYLEYIRNTPLFEDKPKYRKEVERAILEIGADCRAGPLYLQYYQMISENYRHQFFKKIFTRALLNMEEIYALFQNWFASLSEEQRKSIVAKQSKGRINNLQPDEVKTFLTQEIIQAYHKSLAYRQKRLALQKSIKVFYFNGEEQTLDEDMVRWKQLVEFQRDNGVVENTSYCYERMLMAQTHRIELWEEVIHYLQNQTNKYTKVLNMFRFNRAFFLKFNTDLYFYWCDLEERENAGQARKMYLELEKQKNSIEVVLRHIQFQIRDKQWQNAKNLFDALIMQYQGNSEKVDLLSYILVEYSNYVTKYYKDYEYPKKLLKSYFDYLPYNHYLFTNYLNFLVNFEYKEGYYDELMAVIIEGLKKAKKAMNDEQFEKKVLRMTKQHLRTVLKSIYLIKLSERKMMEIQFDKPE